MKWSLSNFFFSLKDPGKVKRQSTHWEEYLEMHLTKNLYLEYTVIKRGQKA